MSFDLGQRFDIWDSLVQLLRACSKSVDHSDPEGEIEKISEVLAELTVNAIPAISVKELKRLPSDVEISVTLWRESIWKLDDFALIHTSPRTACCKAVRELKAGGVARAERRDLTAYIVKRTPVQRLKELREAIKDADRREWVTLIPLGDISLRLRAGVMILKPANEAIGTTAKPAEEKRRERKAERDRQIVEAVNAEIKKWPKITAAYRAVAGRMRLSEKQSSDATTKRNPRNPGTIRDASPNVPKCPQTRGTLRLNPIEADHEPRNPTKTEITPRRALFDGARARDAMRFQKGLFRRAPPARSRSSSSDDDGPRRALQRIGGHCVARVADKDSRGSRLMVPLRTSAPRVVPSAPVG